MIGRMLRALAPLLLVFGVAGPATPTVHVTSAAAEWTSTWNAALGYAPAVGGWNNQTLRQVVDYRGQRTSYLGGCHRVGSKGRHVVLVAD